MYRIGVATVFNINNYGSVLQTYALQKKLEQLGYVPHVISLPTKGKHGTIKRIIRILKLGLRILRYPSLLKTTIKIKQSGEIISIKTSANLKSKYKEFITNNLQILELPGKILKKEAKQENNYAYICGSDQVWQGVMFIINKVTFLRFAPQHKRIAYAPSFGGTIAYYNKVRYKKYINEIPYLSIREILGAAEIKSLNGRSALVALDPTLLVENEFWKERAILPETKEDYILCYFLNEPSPIAVKHIEYLKNKYNCKIKLIPYTNKLSENFDVEVCEPSPFEFLGYFDKAKFVCTDSFHGVAFSLSYNKDFFVYHREYTHSYPQTSRIDSILTLTGQDARLIENEDFNSIEDKIDYKLVNAKIAERRKISLDFLTNSLKSIGENNELL
jgi:hypothetical protein